MPYAEELEELLGLTSVTYRYNLSPEELFKEAIGNDRGRVSNDGPADAQKAFPTALGANGPLVFYTDPDCTGRPVQDTFAVAYPEYEDTIWWKPDFKRFDPAAYEALLERVVTFLNEKQRNLYVQDLFCGSDPGYAIPFRFVGEYAAHAHFCRNMFPKVGGVVDRAKRFTLLNVPSFPFEGARDGGREGSDRAVVVDLRHRIGLVLGPADYCGVNKKTVFTVMNYLLPELGLLSMHCSANVGDSGDGAILFGLSGTGKTTLSADSARRLIGDDETVWSAQGLSNLEDGCYAKLIDLDKQAEPVIAAALSMPGTIIENVPPLPGKRIEECDPQDLDLRDRSITENTRFSYPLDCNPNVMPGARGPHPATIVLLTADAFGVLPPVAILEGKEVMYHFVSGFTSKLAGTEVGITEPKAAFSACFGAPFMSRPPSFYAKLLDELMSKHAARCVLLNTGWTGGAYGTGTRISIKDTRTLLNAALAGDLHKEGMEYVVHPHFNLRVPKYVAGVDDAVLDPRGQWSDPSAYDEAAKKLVEMFRENFIKNGFADLGIEAVM